MSKKEFDKHPVRQVEQRVDKIQSAREKLPYSFIKVGDKKVNYLPQIDLGEEKQDLFSGYTNCTMYVLNEFCVGNRHEKKDEVTHIFPLEVNDNILVPSSTLKGCIQNFVAALKGLPITKLNNHHYSFRPNNAFGNNLHQAAGIVERINGDGSMVVKKFRETKYVFSSLMQVNGNYSYTDQSTNNKGEPITMQKYLLNRGSNRSEFTFFPYHDGLDGLGTLGDRAKPQKTHICFGIRVSSPGASPDLFPDEYIVSKDKAAEYAQTISVLADDKIGHLKDHPSVENDNDLSIIASNIGDYSQFSVGDLIFFEHELKMTEVISYGKHFRYRWAYSRSLHDFSSDYQPYNLDELKDGKLNLIEELFGYCIDEKELPHELRAKSGKIHFSYAILEQDANGKRYTKHLPRPGSPKPSSYEFYLRQNRKAQTIPLTTYGDPARADYKTAPRLSGRKFYFTGSQTPPPPNEENLKDSVMLHNVIKPGQNKYPVFHFRVHFENLRVNELALLCFALCLGQNEVPPPKLDKHTYCHQIGYGKNHGMGAVKIVVDDNMLLLVNKIDSDNGLIKKTPMRLKPMESWKIWMDELSPMFRFSEIERSYPIEKGEIYTWHTNVKNNDLKLRREKGK
ncbi:hypothetical protein MASR1M36_00620 [Candidatus Cloacimonadaceae bacterium]